MDDKLLRKDRMQGHITACIRTVMTPHCAEIFVAKKVNPSIEMREMSFLGFARYPHYGKQNPSASHARSCDDKVYILY